MWLSLVLTLLVITLVVSLGKPWVGLVVYYLYALLIPHIVWRWVFQGTLLRDSSYYLAIFVMAGVVGGLLSGKITFAPLKDRQNFFLFMLWGCIVLSYFFNPYGPNESKEIYFNSNYLLTGYHKVFTIYFLGTVLIATRRRLLVLALLFPLTIVYFTYWGNYQYFAGMMDSPRLPGPGSIYQDENAFAMLFAAGSPSLFYFGQYFKQKIIKYFLWACIPLSWHVLFLTGSMGGLISLGVVTLFMVMRSKNKLFKMVLPLVFAVAFAYQGGEYLKDKAESSAGDVREVETAQSRFDSWHTGFLMTIDHPLTGVGLGNFFRAYSDFSSTHPFVAHNTTIQYAAETGVPSAFLYLALVWFVFYRFLGEIRRPDFLDDRLMRAVNESVAAGVLGFFVSSMFLNLATYELFFYLLLVGFSAHKVKNQELAIQKNENIVP